MPGESTTFAQSLDSRAATGLSAVPMFHAAWLFAVGVAATQAVWLRPGWVLVALGLVAALAVAAALRAQRIAWLPLALLWLLLGAWCAQMTPQPAPAPGVDALSDGLLRVVEGTVVDAGSLRDEAEQDLDDSALSASQRLSQRVDVKVSRLEVVTDSSDGQSPVTGAIRLTIRWPAGTSGSNPLLRCGERIRAAVRLLKPEVYHDPGVWNREDFLVAEGVTATASVAAERVERMGQAPGRFLPCRIAGLQHASSNRLLALPAAMRRFPAPLRLSHDDAVMLAAMVTGDRTYLTHSLRVGFERTGSFHMLVVSGFHLAIVAGYIFWLAKRLRLPRIPATLVTILASFGYALFTGFGTPVQRSLWMVTLYLVGRLFYRERSPLNTIGFAALCLLAVSPRSLFDSSFQMTLLAVVAIAGVAAPLLQATVHPYITATGDLNLVAVDVKLPPPIAQFRVVLRMVAGRLRPLAGKRLSWRVFPRSVGFLLRLWELLVVSFVVEMAMTLPMALYFHRITLFALPVNLFILPLLALLMPAALVTLAALAVWPPAAVWPAIAVAVVLHAGVGLVHLFGSMAFGDLRIPTPLGWQAAAFCALLAAAIVLASGPRWQRRLALSALVGCAVAAIAPPPMQHPHNALLFEAIDVGQGDSLLLITPDGHTLLVDGGGFGGGPRQAPQEFDIGEEVVSEVLWSRGIRHLDAVALTHAHSDHMGGLPAVLRNFRPDELWVGNNPRFGAYQALLDEADALHVHTRSFRTGDGFAFGGAQVAVLAPFPSYQPGPEPGNNDSLVMRVGYGATSVLLEGDAEAPVEDAMLANPSLASTLLKVGHHGSRTSTQAAFLARVAPQWAVISCGLHNRYGHPRQEVLEELQEAHVRTYRTDLGGAACFLLDGKTTAAESQCATAQER